MVSDYLGEAGFRVTHAANGRSGLALHGRDTFDVIVLDLMLPDIDGLDVCRQVRAQAETPILMLTARGDAMDRVVGLEMGADDYLPKPFEPRELLARLRAILRRQRGAPAPFLSVCSAAGARGARRTRHVARGADGSRQGRGARSLRPLDRRSHLAHPRGDRGRSEETAPGRHRARRRLRVRQGAGLARGPAMKRLYLHFYLTIVASLVLVGVAAGLLFRMAVDVTPAERAFEIAGEVAAAAIPPADAAREVQQRAIARLSERLRVDLALFDAARAPIAAAGNALPAPGRFRRGSGWIYGMRGPAWSIRLPDGRWLVAGVPARRWHPGLALLKIP